MGFRGSRILTAKRKEIFLKSLAISGNVSKAVQYADFCRRTAYDHRERDPDFAAAWDDALEQYADKLELEADRRAVKGWLEPVFHLGEICGKKRKFSDTLLIFRLKALRPEKYRERSETDVNLKTPDPLMIALSKATPEQLRELIDRHTPGPQGS